MTLQSRAAGIPLDPSSDAIADSAGNEKWRERRTSLTVAILGTVGTVGAAVITGIFGLPGGGDAVQAKESPSGISYDYSGDYAKSEVAVNGSATDNVDVVAVLVGPRSVDGNFWTGSANVVGGAWNVTIKTDPSLPKPFVVQAIPHRSQHNTAAGADTVRLYSFEPGDDSTGSDNSTPAESPGPASAPLECAVQNGTDCFTGPDWGAPVIRQSGGQS